MPIMKRKPRTYILTVRLSAPEKAALLALRSRGELISETLRRVIAEAVRK